MNQTVTLDVAAPDAAATAALAKKLSDALAEFEWPTSIEVTLDPPYTYSTSESGDGSVNVGVDLASGPDETVIFKSVRGEGDVNAFVSDVAEEMAADLDDQIAAAVNEAEEQAAAFHVVQLRALEARHEEEKLIAYERGLKDASRKYEEELAKAADEIKDLAGLRMVECEAYARELDDATEEAYTKGYHAGFNAESPIDAEVLPLIRAMLRELQRARASFTGDNVTFAALVEEVGELSTALFSEEVEAVNAKAIQVAVMACRIILDGDHTFGAWRAARGLSPLAGPDGEGVDF
ncbi:MAG: hypothetical protein AAGK03_03430 [Pseudomonadota bacterium]